MVKVLVGSPVHQDHEILKEFLTSLKELFINDIELSFYFVDDNADFESSKLLINFNEEMSNVKILKAGKGAKYICDNYTHRWNEDLVAKVSKFKNRIIDYAKENSFDYLFLIDSDIVLHPNTLERLISTSKEIVANIFWTKWNPDVEPLPQVWLKDFYTLYPAKANETITHGEVSIKTNEFLEMLRKPGTYEVGGLGACTLISRKALLTGVNFNDLYNISFWGEDRHFCIRAAALGIQLFVDTYYPAYHIYRYEDLAGVKEFKENAAKRVTEIVGSTVLDVIVEGLRAVGNYSFENLISDDISNYFTSRETEKQIMDIKNNKNKIVKSEIINRTQVMKCEITFYNNTTKIMAKVRYNNSGFRGDFSYYDEYDGEVVASLQTDSVWRIDEFNPGQKVILDMIPFIRKSKPSGNKLTLSMVVKNESDRYLKQVLQSAREYIDNAVIIDDGSTDNTIAICKEILKDIPLTIIENKDSKFATEVALRTQQWYETIATNPDWIIFLDADEIFEDRFKYEVQAMINNREVDSYIFRLYDFWNYDYYRSDALWNAHNTYRPFMIRYQKNFKYIFRNSNQHCGRMPANVLELPYGKSNMRLKHYGWSKIEDRISKYERYMTLDPGGKDGSLPQYKSILDEKPTLSKWSEKE